MFLKPLARPIRGAFETFGAVYGVLDVKGTVLYVGRTDSLKRRIDEHLADRGHCMHRHGAAFVVQEWIATESARQQRERELYDEYQPPCNDIRP